MSGPSTRRAASDAGVARPTVTVCRGCCCGTRKVRLLDHTAQLVDLRQSLTGMAMRWAKAEGLRWFDFGGLRAPTLRALLDGGAGSGEQPSVDRFKTNFGGTPYRYPVAVEVIGSPVLRVTYDLIRRWPAGRQLVVLATRMARGTIAPRNTIKTLRGHDR